MKLGTPIRNVTVDDLEIDVGVVKWNAEDLVIEHYKNMGLTAEKTKDISNALKEQYSRLGMPDLLVQGTYNGKEEYFFVEVKDRHDALRREQLRWCQRYPQIRVVIMFVKQNWSYPAQAKYKDDGVMETSTGLSFKLITSA